MMSDEIEANPTDYAELTYDYERVDERSETGTMLFIAWAMLCLVILALLIMIGYNRPPAGL
jgi:hypothetical protein